MEQPETDPPGDRAGRGEDRCLVQRALAGAEKGAEADGRSIVWVDQSGFALLPSVVRTYAPVGETPILRVPLRREHVSAIGGITMDGKLFLQKQERAYRSPDVVRFLKHLLRHIEGKLLVIWDGAPIHRSEVIKGFLVDGGAQRIQLEQLPGYAPELNAAEGLWRYLKRVELRNLCCANLRGLQEELRRAVARLRQKPEIIRSCVRLIGYHA